jgi:hypothetical protein
VGFFNAECGTPLFCIVAGTGLRHTLSASWMGIAVESFVSSGRNPRPDSNSWVSGAWEEMLHSPHLMSPGREPQIRMKGLRKRDKLLVRRIGASFTAKQ